MYANVPHTSAATTPMAPPSAPPATAAQVQHGLPQALPPQVHPGNLGASALTPPAPGLQQAAAPLMQYGAPAPAPAARARAASYVTGAYQASGDPAIDRMIRLEAACKRFGSPF